MARLEIYLFMGRLISIIPESFAPKVYCFLMLYRHDVVLECTLAISGGSGNT